MDRRAFVLTTLGLSAAAATAVDLDAPGAVAMTPLALRKASGTRVRVSGWLGPVRSGAGHYLTLSATPDRSDPCSSDVNAWSDDLVRIYPDRAGLRPGRTELVGRLWYGHSRDEATGHAARIVLTEAKPA